jgi:VWFA-related protein
MMARRARTLLISVAAAAAILSETGGHLHAQDAGGGLTIRTETRVVLVDAVVADKKGKFIRDLAANDFQVWEDGKEQRISGFSLESSGVSPERPAAHYIAMFFDTSRVDQASQATLRREGIRFVDGFASPDRYMAVANYNTNGGLRIAQNFTTERDRLKKALAEVPAGWSPDPITGGEGEIALRTRGRGRGNAAPAADTSGYRNMLSSLRSLADSLAVIRGRKALVFFGGASPVSGDLLSDVKATIDACNKANVAVYTVDSKPAASGGGTADITSAGPAQSIMRLDAGPQDRSVIRSLAEGTGGVAFLNTNDIAESLGKVAQEQDQYYLLSYTPSVDSAEGSCHELRVKVERKGADVRARRSYCTSKPADALSGKPAGKDLETRAASGGGKMTAKMQLPWFYSAPGIARVDVAMDIVPSGMKFTKEKGKLHGEFDLAGVAYKPDGSIAARMSDAVKLEFDSQQQVDAYLKTPYHYQNQFEIAPGEYTFRMAFSSDSSGTNGFGKAEMPLRIDPWNGQTLSMSGLALSHDVHPAADLAGDLDVSLLEGPRPLVSRGFEAVPSGTVQFHAGEPGYLYVEAYEPLLAAVKAGAPLPVVGVRVRVLDRSTGQQKQDTGFRSAGIYERPGNPVIAIASPLTIAGLPVGAYRLEVSVVRETGAPVIRTADFEID